MTGLKNKLDTLETGNQTRTDSQGEMQNARRAQWIAQHERLENTLGGPAPVKVLVFHGYGTPEGLSISGRVIEERDAPDRSKNEKGYASGPADLLARYRRSGGSEVPHALLAVRFQEREQMVTADEGGFFEATIVPTRPLVEHRLWHPVELQLLQPIPAAQSRYPIKAVAQALVPPPSARLR